MDEDKVTSEDQPIIKFMNEMTKDDKYTGKYMD